MAALPQSVFIALLAALGTALIGGGGGVLAHLARIRPRAWWILTVFFPILWPPFFTAIGWMVALGESGLTLFQRSGFDTVGLSLLFSPWGVAAAHILSYWPIPAILAWWGLRSLDPRLADQLRLEGGSRARLWALHARFAAPSILQGALLVAVISLNDLGAAEMLQVTTFPMVLFTELNLSRDLAALAGMSWPLVGFLLLVGASWPFLRRLSSVEREPALEVTRSDRRVAGGWCVLLAGLLLSLGPGVALHVEVGGFLSDLSAVHLELIGECVEATLLAAGGSMALVVALCAVLSLLPPSARARTFLESTLFCLFALPSPILSLALIAAMNPLPHFLVGWADTFWILSAACALRFLWPSWMILRISEEQMDRELDSLAAIEGLRGVRRLVWVHFPLHRNAWLAGAGLAWVFTVGEGVMTRILQPPGVQTLAARTINFMHWGHDGMVAAGLLVLGLLEVVPLLLGVLWLQTRRAPEARA
ncbi:MAG: ABC transporter permease subunit [Candidatus Omnitrophica bacterium]|nr:ABC transporter permease subunit [Candidatus Omnitrophota bacterium]